MTVSIGRVHSPGKAADYFANDNYYTAEQSEAASVWMGEGSRDLGLSGTVEASVFEKILDGKLPDGTQVNNPETRDYGRDFTFSMPKSASLLALVSGDTRILAAHLQAVKETMAWAEKNLAEARVHVGGKDVAVRTGNLVYALFQHDTSRATDPQSHIHAVIANLTRLADFVETYARTCRKYGASLITATQSLNDYYKSEGSIAALENSDWFVILQQKPETIADFKKLDRFDMNDAVEAMMRSIKRNGTEYSDMIIKGPEMLAMGRLVLDPYSATLYSSSPNVFAAIDEKTAAGLTMAEAIEEVAFPGSVKSQDRRGDYAEAAE